MKHPVNSRPLFIFEMANNHMGSVEHGLKIIREIHEVLGEFQDTFDFAFKLQFRHLDTFIHPDFRDRLDYKYVRRFQETRIAPEEFRLLKEEMTKLGFLAICTPFDERSVDLIEELEFDIIKIGSCSFTDWPLLERVVRSEKPIICSAAGIALEDIDNVVSFMSHRNKDMALMHCVAEYPTSPENLQLNQIDLFRNRFPEVRIGFSTHENPENHDAVKIAVAKGASIFEKHVGVAAEGIALNDYSASPAQVVRWLEAAREAYAMCGTAGERCRFTEKEVDSLVALRRGAFAKRTIAKGERVMLSDVFFAIPTIKNQVTANDMSKYTHFTAEQEILENQPVLLSSVTRIEMRENILAIAKKIAALLKESGVVTPRVLDLEISHHHGVDRFYQTGAAIVNFLNREYCKKLIIILPGQTHPEQYHHKKEETFIVLYGEVFITLDNVRKTACRGDIITVERGVKHIFGSEKGAVIEEISSTHYKDDSYYTDPEIMKNRERKTLITYRLD